ncbi:hypothetical protein J6590_016355 [Homalodisca vitripennis]|nr:hypothetical protein J6590_016355 [Homalodisca vitripennis]
MNSVSIDEIKISQLISSILLLFEAMVSTLLKPTLARLKAGMALGKCQLPHNTPGLLPAALNDGIHEAFKRMPARISAWTVKLPLASLTPIIAVGRKLRLCTSSKISSKGIQLHLDPCRNSEKDHVLTLSSRIQPPSGRPQILYMLGFSFDFITAGINHTVQSGRGRNTNDVTRTVQSGHSRRTDVVQRIVQHSGHSRRTDVVQRIVQHSGHSRRTDVVQRIVQHSGHSRKTDGVHRNLQTSGYIRKAEGGWCTSQYEKVAIVERQTVYTAICNQVVISGRQTVYIALCNKVVIAGRRTVYTAICKQVVISGRRTVYTAI